MKNNRQSAVDTDMDRIPATNEIASVPKTPGILILMSLALIIILAPILIGSSTSTADMQFLRYAPPPRDSKATYESFLDKLGFKRANSVTRDHAYETRTAFIADMKQYVDSSDYRYLCRSDNEEAFDKMIKGFLLEYGSKYWGSSNRDHLGEEDLSKGFLYPRDMERRGSRYLTGFAMI